MARCYLEYKNQSHPNLRVAFPYIVTNQLRVLIITCVYIIFRIAKQKITARIATALKTVFSVAKTIIRLSRRKLHTGNVYHFFWNILFHIHYSIKYKKSAFQKERTKKCIPLICCHTNVLAYANPTKVWEKGENTFYQKVFSLR